MTSTRALVAASLVLSCLAGGARQAAADDNHYQNYLVGERAVGLGGAFTAIADDSSAAFYNPAGLAEVPYSSLSLSAAVYGFASEATTIDVVGIELTGRTFVSYPTTAAWIQLLRQGDPKSGVGRMQAAVSLITPRSVVRRRRFAFEGAQGEVPTETWDLLEVEIAEDDTLWIGLSFAWKLHQRISVGATLYTAVRSGMYQFYDLEIKHLADAATGQEIDRRPLGTRIEGKLLHVGLLGVVGAVVAPSERLRLGAAFRTPLAPLHGKISLNTMVVAEAEPSGFAMGSFDEEADFNDKQPFKATLGVAYFRPRHYGLSLDFSIYGPVGEHFMISDSGDAYLDGLTPMRKRLLWQLNVGGEYYLRRSFALRLGFFTNLSSMESCPSSDTPDSCNEIFADPVDRFGVSGSVGYEIDRATLTLGWSYNFGSRRSNVDGVAVEEARSFLMLMLGSSFRF